jgi:MFS family permease
MRAYLPTALRGLQRQSAAHPRRSHPWVMVWTLAVAQVISWGTLFYAFSLFVVPMQASLGWSRPLLNSALSLGLLSTGVVAFPVGSWIDRHGGRGVMTLGSLAGGLLLLAWASVETPWMFYLIWMLIGVSMAGVLYEPAFAVITAAFGPDARRGITALTLVGGFASTVFMPLT